MRFKAIQTFSACAALLLAKSAYAGDLPQMHANARAVSGMGQVVPVGSALPKPFIAQVTDDDGNPLEGVTVGFEVNGCVVFSMVPQSAPECPPYALYGTFGNSSDAATSTTDHNGIATSALFTAGSIPGHYTVFAYIPFFEPWKARN